MADVHRLNPHGMLVLLGATMYAVVGGSPVIGGGFLIAVTLGIWRRWEASAGGCGPTSLFGAAEPSQRHVRVIEAPPALRLLPAMAAVRPLQP